MTTKKSNEQMQKVEVIIHIDAPREAVWAYMADLPFVRALPFTTMEVIGEPVNVGTVNRLTFALPFGVTFRFDEVVTEWVENERIAYRAISGWAMEAEAVLKPEDGGTCFRFTLHYRFPGLWKLTPHWLMELGCRQGLKNLKKMIEAKPKKKGMENAYPTEFH
ncbi:MAG: SRPBCC family protein [Bellilinea sp.]